MVALKTVVAAATLAVAASALPSSFRPSARRVQFYNTLVARQEQGAPAGQQLTDDKIANFALTLEHLELAFYDDGLKRFGEQMDEKTKALVKKIRDTEEAHVIKLQSTIAPLGVKPVETCEYNFAAVTDLASMLKIGSMFEDLGVSAYLGAAPAVQDKKVLALAASIVTVESRHASLVNQAQNLDPVAKPFDVALSPQAVFSMAKPFIKSCPPGSDLPFQAFPALQPDGAQAQEAGAAGAPGATLKFKAEGGVEEQATQCAFTAGTDVAPSNALYAAYSKAEGCVAPPGVSGNTFVFLMKKAVPDFSITDDNIVAGPMGMLFNKI